MIDRYVFIKLKAEHATAQGRSEVAAGARKLDALPGVHSVTVGTPADAGSATAWDISLVLRFDDVVAVEAYRIHPDHRVFVDEFLAPRMEVIKAWNFEV